MRLTPLLGLTLWVVAAGGQDPEATDHMQQYHEQDGRGNYRYGFKTADQMAEAEGDPNSEVKGKYAYVDENGDMQGVEYTAGVNGFLPKTLKKEEAEASILVPEIIQPNTEDKGPINDHLKNRAYRNKPEAVHYSQRARVVEQEDETDGEIRVTEEDAGRTDKSEVKNPTGHDEERTKISNKETVQGKYSYIEQDGLPATIEYEAGPEIGFVVKGFTKESLQSKLIEKGSDTVYDKEGLTVRKESSPEKFIYTEEGTEETSPEGFVRGLYTFTGEDGIPATVEYEAGPKIGFVVKSFSKGNSPGKQLDQDTGTSLNVNTFIDPTSIQDDSSEGESIKFNVNNNKEPINNLKKEYSSSNLTLKVPVDQEHNQDNDSAQVSSFTNHPISQNVEQIRSVEDFVEQPDEEGETEVPMNAAYRFGYSIKGQSRHEQADSLGNVNGNYSYVDGAGLLTKVEYEAGAKKGFIIKRMTREHTKTPKISPKSEMHKTPDLSLTERDFERQDSLTKEKNIERKSTNSEKQTVSNQPNKLNNYNYLDETIVDGYGASPYVLKEYVDERNLPVRDDLNIGLQSSDRDSTVASGSNKYFRYAYPESLNFNSNGPHDYKSAEKSEAIQKHVFSQDANTVLTASPYSIYFRNPIDSGIQHEEPTRKSYEYFLNLPRPENQQSYQNALNKAQDPYNTQSNTGFPVYGPPRDNTPLTFVSPDLDRKKTGTKKHKQKHKMMVKRPKHPTNNQNLTNLLPDGSYSFSYKAKDHSREQSIDRYGKVHLKYQVKTDKDGNTLVIFSNQVPQNLGITNG